jgi:hypothetical protein
MYPHCFVLIHFERIFTPNTYLNAPERQLPRRPPTVPTITYRINLSLSPLSVPVSPGPPPPPMHRAVGNRSSPPSSYTPSRHWAVVAPTAGAVEDVIVAVKTVCQLLLTFFVCFTYHGSVSDPDSLIPDPDPAF